MDLTVATTASKLKSYGTVTGRRAGAKVTLKLFQDVGEGFTRLAVRRTKVRKKGRYAAAFPRPSGGTCKIVAVYRSTKATRTLPCHRPTFGTGTATLSNGQSMVEIDVEIASNSEQRGYGLMYRKWLHPDKGMVFRFDTDSDGGFWMANTLIPLSIAFYDAAGVIVRIMDMEPCEDPSTSSCPIYKPEVSYRKALEVNQGAFEKWGISEGDVIIDSD